LGLNILEFLIVTQPERVVEGNRDQLQKLLALKRYERPDDGYWEDFLGEFHDRQRRMSPRVPLVSAAWNRFAGGFGEVGSSKWLCTAGVAYAVVTSVFLSGLAAGDRPGGVREDSVSLLPSVRESVATAATPP